MIHQTPIGPIQANWTETQRKELKEYFLGRRRTFTHPKFEGGTPFQRKVWQALLRIPYGETRTYSQVAKMIGQPNAQRAVGNAVGKNPLVIVVPCHRVVRSDGTIGGFSGGRGIKPKLLRLEGVAL